MTVKELREKLNLEVVVEGNSDREIKGGYAGDLLSFVMSRIESDDIWLTVMGNINSIAVASLSDCSAILLTENSHLDDDAKIKAEAINVSILRSDKNSFNLASEISALLK